MSEPESEAVKIEPLADPMPQIEYWHQASRRWRKLALGTLAGLGVILALAMVQFVATWMALGKLVETRQEMARTEGDLKGEIAQFQRDTDSALHRMNTLKCEMEVLLVQQFRDRAMQQPDLEAEVNSVPLAPAPFPRGTERDWMLLCPGKAPGQPTSAAGPQPVRKP